MEFKMNKMDELIKELKLLDASIISYTKYLKEYTYHPYDKVEEFSVKLRTIIEKYDNYVLCGN